MAIDFAQKIKSLRAEIEALKTATRQNPDGLQTITKTINFTAKMIVYSTYVSGYYFLELSPASADNRLIFSASQKHATAADDVLIDSAVPTLKNGNVGFEIEVAINRQRQQYYLENYNQGDIIQMPVSIKITASDDFSYTLTEDN